MFNNVGHQIAVLIIYRGTTSFTRKSCQTVLAEHLLSITRVLAPILPHLAEDVWQNLPFQYILEDGSAAKFVFDARWPAANERWLAISPEEINYWGEILEVIYLCLLLSLTPLVVCLSIYLHCPARREWNRG